MSNVKMQICSLCKNPRKAVIAVAGPKGTTLVGRCLTCDTLPCPNCKGGRTIDPTAKNCKHCGCDIDLRRRID